MGALRNSKQEAFARNIFLSPRTGWSAKRCYREAGYVAHNGNSSEACASRLLSSAKVKARLAELNRPLVQKSEISMERLIDQLLADRELARRLGQPSAAIRATQVIAMICGFLVKREENGPPGDFIGLRTSEEILADIESSFGNEAAVGIRRAFGIESGLQAGHKNGLNGQASEVIDESEQNT